MSNKKTKESNAGVITLVVCGVLAIALIVGCVFFPEEIFGIFLG